MILDSSVDRLLSSVSPCDYLLICFDEVHLLGDCATHLIEPLATHLGVLSHF